MSTVQTVRPFAIVPVDGDAAELLNRLSEALEHDGRAIAPALGYDYEKARVDAIFQVDPDDRSMADIGETSLTVATHEAQEIFDSALERSGLAARTAGVAVVDGDDPDLLP